MQWRIWHSILIMASRNLVVVIVDENYQIQNNTDGNLAYAEICDNKRHVGSSTCLISTNC